MMQYNDREPQTQTFTDFEGIALSIAILHGHIITSIIIGEIVAVKITLEKTTDEK